MKNIGSILFGQLFYLCQHQKLSMIRCLTVLIIILFKFSAVAQILDDGYQNMSNRGGFVSTDSTRIGDGQTIINLSEETFYTDYKIIDYKKDTTYIDTTLSIKKEYEMNYLRKDNFELMAFIKISCMTFCLCQKQFQIQ